MATATILAVAIEGVDVVKVVEAAAEGGVLARDFSQIDLRFDCI